MEERNPQDEGIGALIGRAFADGRDYAEAELGYWKALAADRVADAKSAAILAVVALLLVQAAAIGLIVGLLMSLTPLVGPGFATLIVVGVTLLVAALIARTMLAKIRRIARPRGEP